MRGTIVSDLPPRICRAARYMLAISRAELSHRAGVCKNAVARFEEGNLSQQRLERYAKLFRRTLTASGIDFVVDHRGVVGCAIAHRATSATNGAEKNRGNPRLSSCDLTDV